MPRFIDIGLFLFLCLAGAFSLQGCGEIWGAVTWNSLSQIQLVQNNSSSGAGITTLAKSFGSANVQNNFIILAIGTNQNVTLITDSNANNYFLATSATQAGATTYIYYAPNIAPGNNTVTVHIGVAGTITLNISEFSGVALSAPLDQTATSIGSSVNVILPSVTTSQISELVYSAALSNLGGETWTAGSGFNFVSSGPSGAEEYLIGPSNGPFTPTFTMTILSNWEAVAATFYAQ